MGYMSMANKAKPEIKIVDRENRGSVIILTVEAIIDGTTHKTNFNFRPETLKTGQWKRAIKNWVEDIKNAPAVEEMLPKVGEKLTLD